MNLGCCYFRVCEKTAIPYCKTFEWKYLIFIPFLSLPLLILFNVSTAAFSVHSFWRNIYKLLLISYSIISTSSEIAPQLHAFSFKQKIFKQHQGEIGKKTNKR